MRFFRRFFNIQPPDVVGSTFTIKVEGIVGGINGVVKHQSARPGMSQLGRSEGPTVDGCPGLDG